MKPTNKKVVICGGVRTPIGHLGKSLAKFLPEELMEIAIRALMQRTSLYPHAVDGVLGGMGGPRVPRAQHRPRLRAQSRPAGKSPGLHHSTKLHLKLGNRGQRLPPHHHGRRRPLPGRRHRVHVQFPLRHPRPPGPQKTSVPGNGEGPLVGTLERPRHRHHRHNRRRPHRSHLQNQHGGHRGGLRPNLFHHTGSPRRLRARQLPKGLNAEKRGFYDTHVVPITKNGAPVLARDEYPFLREGWWKNPK
jgi:hypothetical protein